MMFVASALPVSYYVIISNLARVKARRLDGCPAGGEQVVCNAPCATRGEDMRGYSKIKVIKQTEFSSLPVPRWAP